MYLPPPPRNVSWKSFVSFQGKHKLWLKSPRQPTFSGLKKISPRIAPSLLQWNSVSKNPKLPGQDIYYFSKVGWRAQANWKTLHVKCNCCYAADIRRLTQSAKEADLVSKKWGKHAHVSEVVDKDSTSSEIKCLIKVVQTHTNNQCCMILKDVDGITNLDGTVVIYNEETYNFLGFLSLCHVLLCYLRLSNGHQLIAEIH